MIILLWFEYPKIFKISGFTHTRGRGLVTPYELVIELPIYLARPRGRYEPRLPLPRPLFDLLSDID